jgi:hypothetical protein
MTTHQHSNYQFSTKYGTVTYNFTGLLSSYYFRIQKILMGTFHSGQSAINTAAAEPATPTGLYANTVTQKYLQGMQQQEQRVCLVSFYQANGIYDVVMEIQLTQTIWIIFNTGYYILLPSTGLFWSYYSAQ